MDKKSIFLAGALICGAPEISTGGSACYALEDDRAPVSLLFECIRQQTEDIERLRNEVSEARYQLRSLERQSLKHAPEKDLFPRGVVVPFDLPGGCPEGWTTFEAGKGRIIIGVNADGAHGLKKRPYPEIGGEEEVTLSEAQMPEHFHSMLRNGAHSGWGASPGAASIGILPSVDTPENRTRPAGSSQPHNNMPPYIALYFCKKD